MRRRSIIIGLVLILACLWSWRYIALNRHYQSIATDQGRIYFEMGEEVQLGGYKMDKHTKDLTGYSIVVNSFEIMDAKDYLEMINISESDLPMAVSYEKIAVAKIVLKNTNSDEESINLFSFSLCGIDWSIPVDYSLLPLSNPILEGNPGIHLPHDSSVELMLPFSLFQNIVYSDWNKLEKIPMYLSFTYQPAKLTVKLQQ